MIILNMGIPRSGTVWAFNVIRVVFEEHQVPYRPVNANAPDEVDAALAGHDPETHMILHFHDITAVVERAAADPDTFSFFNYRDPRDVVCSQMRLHDAGFDIAVEMTANAYKMFDKALAMPRLMFLPYPHVVGHAEALIFQMGLAMGFLLDLEMAADIAARTSADRHRRVMEGVAERSGGDGAAAAGADGGDVLRSFSGKRWVSMDKTHLINDRHIQSGATGRWRDELDADQQATVNRVFAHPIKILGFDRVEA